MLDAANKTMSCYVDGAKAGQVGNVNLTLDHVLAQPQGDSNHAFVGRSQDDAAPRLNALVHDFRIYSVSLTEQQVAVIRSNRLAGSEVASTSAAARQARQTLIGSGIAQPMAEALMGVSDVTVETTVGNLPRLPYRVPGKYRDKAKGPAVRVVWPAPTNNLQVLTAGVYTVVGKVPGTDFPAKATVKVNQSSKKLELPARHLETFPLGSVTLQQNDRRQDTHFIRNRDKFLQVLAQTNPDRFLYMFRDAFGQPQPPGAEPLRGWDNQTTRLRGHATGHYLSAVAQACASTAYDVALHAEFKKKMDYLIDSLYELSQKSGSPTHAAGRLWPKRPPFRSVRAGRITTPTLARMEFARIIGTGVKVLSALIRRTSSSCWNEGRPMEATTIKFGRPITRCTKSSRACSIAMKWVETKRRWPLPKGWRVGCINGLLRFQPKLASACGIATLPANTAA